MPEFRKSVLIKAAQTYAEVRCPGTWAELIRAIDKLVDESRSEATAECELKLAQYRTALETLAHEFELRHTGKVAWRSNGDAALQTARVLLGKEQP